MMVSTKGSPFWWLHIPQSKAGKWISVLLSQSGFYPFAVEYCYSCSLLLVLIYGSSIWMKIHNASSSSICLAHFPSFCLISLPMPAPSLLADPLCLGTRSLSASGLSWPCIHPGSCWLQTDWSQTMKLRSFAQGRKTIRCNSQFRNCPSRH